MLTNLINEAEGLPHAWRSKIIGRTGVLFLIDAE
jgi:hypothetical protein